jgi:hypothetical protein
MIEKYGGALSHSGKRSYLPPLTEQEITHFMHMDPMSGALALLIDPYEGYTHLVPTVSEPTQPPQVPPLGAVHNVEDVTTYTTVTLSSPRAPHGQIKRTTPTLKWRKPLKRLQVPLKKRQNHTTLTSPHPDTVNPLLVRHFSIARKRGQCRYTLK